MEWVKWLIPVVVVAVIIISQLAAKQPTRQPPPPLPRPRPPRDPDDSAAPRRTSEDLEKFLEEVKRRKQSEETAAEPLYTAQEIPARPAPRPVEQRRQSVAVDSKPQRRSQPRVVVVEPAAPKLRQLAMPSSEVAVLQALQAPASPADAPQAIHRPEALPTVAALPPAAKMVRGLLKNRQSLRAALLLREILDQPLSKRRR